MLGSEDRACPPHCLCSPSLDWLLLGFSTRSGVTKDCDIKQVSFFVEKEMATHSSVLAWRIPGTGKPDGLPSVGSHRVGHD